MLHSVLLPPKIINRDYQKSKKTPPAWQSWSCRLTEGNQPRTCTPASLLLRGAQNPERRDAFNIYFFLKPRGSYWFTRYSVAWSNGMEWNTWAKYLCDTSFLLFVFISQELVSLYSSEIQVCHWRQSSATHQGMRGAVLKHPAGKTLLSGFSPGTE